MESNFDRAVREGLLRIETIGKSERVVYSTVDVSQRWSDPEEKVRAAFYADLVYTYQYPAEVIGVEVRVPDRTPHDAADLVIFTDAGRKTPYAVIEVKTDGISDSAFSQAVEQACGNGTWSKLRASYVGVVAGATRRFLDFTGKYALLERDVNIIADLPRAFGQPEEYKFKKGSSQGYGDIEPVSREALIRAIEKCHQTLWGGGKLSPPAAFGELCKLLFVKNLDERRTARGEHYKFQRKTHERRESLAGRIRSLYDVAREQDPDVFTDTIRIDDATLARVVEHLESIDLQRTDLDTKGVAFERFMDGFFKGDFGQYFTPREIITFAVEMMQPNNSHLIIDPACGSGGFLLHALDYVRHQADRRYPDYKTDTREATDHWRFWHDFAQHNLYGIEINDEIARVAKMNMIIHDDGHTNIVSADALESFDVLSADRPKLRAEQFDLVLTNPPFGAVIKAAEKGEAYLDKFTLRAYAAKGDATSGESDIEVESLTAKSGKRSLKARASIKTEILFLEQAYNFLKAGGRAAIVVPDGILTNSSLLGVRTWILDRFKLLAVISLPQAAFAHFGAGVKASLIFLERRLDGEIPNDDEPIFMAAPENIGYDATGRKSIEVIHEGQDGSFRRELHRSDLFDVEIIYEYHGTESDDPTAWREKSRRVLPESGILGEYRRFERDPQPFFA